MKIVGVGIDIVENDRIRNVKYFDRVAEYVCTPEERTVLPNSRDPVQYVTSCLAAKEAVIKAFPHKLMYQDINLTRTRKGLRVNLLPVDMPVYDIQVSIAHEFKFTVSNAIVSEKI